MAHSDFVTLPELLSLLAADQVLIVRGTDAKRATLDTLQQFVGGGTALEFITVVGEGDDAGLVCTEQWSVGTPGNGKESVFGSGDSYGVGKEDTTPDGDPVLGSAWHADIANTTGDVITAATDITVALSSDNASTSPLFDGTTAGKYILAGSEYPFGGAKAKLDTIGVIEGGNVIMEYLAAPGTWIPVPFMATDSDFPYEQKGNTLGGSLNEQWRGGFDPTNLPTVWPQVTLTINGDDYTKNWARFRIVTPITTDPIMEQIKLHTNRFEINADGNTEYFGRARYPKTILIEKHANSDKTPSNESISIAPGITEVRTANELANNASDGFILSGIIPVGLDTSIPAQVIIDWYPKTANTGDVELELELIKAGPGFVFDGTATPAAAVPIIESVANQENEQIESTFLIDLSTALVGDKIYGSLFRDATVGNDDDTLNGNIVVTGFKVVGYFWRP